jgi:hypothetical protein
MAIEAARGQRRKSNITKYLTLSVRNQYLSCPVQRSLRSKLTLSRSKSGGSFSVDWKSIDSNIIAGTGVDTFQLVDACHAASFLPSTSEGVPDTYNGGGALSVIAASSAETVAGVNQLAFTKAVIHVLAPADGALPASFTPASLWRALPVVNEAFAEILMDGVMQDAILKGSYKPEFYEQATTISTDSRKIGILNC